MSPAERTDADLRKQGLRAQYEGQVLLATDPKVAEVKLRQSMELLVAAFLEDPRANADLFTLAHRIGRVIEKEFGCSMPYDQERAVFSRSCPIHALHGRVGRSITLADVQRQLGRKPSLKERLLDHHCEECPGADVGPSKADLDASLGNPSPPTG